MNTHFSSVTRGLLVAAAITVSSSALSEVQNIFICHAALVDLASFDKASQTFAHQTATSRNRSML